LPPLRYAAADAAVIDTPFRALAAAFAAAAADTPDIAAFLRCRHYASIFDDTRRYASAIIVMPRHYYIDATYCRRLLPAAADDAMIDTPLPPPLPLRLRCQRYSFRYAAAAFDIIDIRRHADTLRLLIYAALLEITPLRF